jgi:hypothetical protein
MRENKNIPFVVTLNTEEKNRKSERYQKWKLDILDINSLLTFNF